jgi:hypothetical protein
VAHLATTHHHYFPNSATPSPSSCKSVYTRASEYLPHTQVNSRTHTHPTGIRGARRLTPLATTHTNSYALGVQSLHWGLTDLLCIYSLRDYAFLGRNDPKASCVRAPHNPAVYPIEIHRAAYSTADGRLIRQYTPAATYMYHT